MQKTTAIEWTDHTVNFWWGCTKVSEACQFCYAEGIDRRFGPKLDSGNTHWGSTASRMDRRAIAETDLEKIDRAAARAGVMARVFVNSMSDWLDPLVPAAWLSDLLVTLCKYPHCNYQLLTKRPQLFAERMEQVIALGGPGGLIARAWLSGHAPGNFWVGATVENQARADERIPALIKIPSFIHFLSCEPLLGQVDLEKSIGGTRWIGGERGCVGQHRGIGTADCPRELHHHHDERCGKGIDWVIAGGESGSQTGIRPSHPDWFRTLRDQCAKSRIPFLFKQWGSWGLSAPLKGGVFDFSKGKTMANDGTIYGDGDLDFPNGMRYGEAIRANHGQCSLTRIYKVGKAESGRMLDGVEHSAFPHFPAMNFPINTQA